MTNQVDWASFYTTNLKLITETLPARTTQHWNQAMYVKHCNVAQGRHGPDLLCTETREKSTKGRQYRQLRTVDRTLGHTYVNYVMMGAFLIAHLQFPFLPRSASLHIRRRLSLATLLTLSPWGQNRSYHGNQNFRLGHPGSCVAGV